MPNVRIIIVAITAALLFAPSVARADAPLVFIPAAPGAALHLHVTRTAQAPDGQHRNAVDIVLRRASAASGTIERSDSGRVSVEPVDFLPDGTLKISASVTPDRADPDLANIIDGLNFALSIVGGGTASGNDAWSALLAPSPTPPPAPNGATPTPAQPTVLPIRIVKTDGVDFDFDGSVQSTQTPAPPQRSLGSNRGGFGGGPFGGGGGGFSRRSRGGEERGPSPNANLSPITILTHVSGHATHGAVVHLVIAQSRSIAVEGLTYVNAGGWSFDITK